MNIYKMDTCVTTIQVKKKNMASTPLAPAPSSSPPQLPYSPNLLGKPFLVLY